MPPELTPIVFSCWLQRPFPLYRRPFFVIKRGMSKQTPRGLPFCIFSDGLARLLAGESTATPLLLFTGRRKLNSCVIIGYFQPAYRISPR